MNKNEAFSRVLIDGLLAEQGQQAAATTKAKTAFDALLAQTFTDRL